LSVIPGKVQQLHGNLNGIVHRALWNAAPLTADLRDRAFREAGPAGELGAAHMILLQPGVGPRGLVPDEDKL
jgi:hypothetical protein